MKGLLLAGDKGIDEEAVKQSQNFSWARTAAETVKVYERVYNA